jgi:hypothetical protein
MWHQKSRLAYSNKASKMKCNYYISLLLLFFYYFFSFSYTFKVNAWKLETNCFIYNLGVFLHLDTIKNIHKWMLKSRMKPEKKLQAKYVYKWKRNFHGNLLTNITLKELCFRWVFSFCFYFILQSKLFYCCLESLFHSKSVCFSSILQIFVFVVESEKKSSYYSKLKII